MGLYLENWTKSLVSKQVNILNISLTAVLRMGFTWEKILIFAHWPFLGSKCVFPRCETITMLISRAFDQNLRRTN